MRTELQKILSLKQFFKILQSNEISMRYSLEKPSRLLLQNIHTNWLQFILLKTQKYLPVYLNGNKDFSNKKLPLGFIHQSKLDFENKVFEQNLDEFTPKQKSELKFNLLVPEQDTMPYFIQWQRYRKYWWSSITTTPSLFSIDDIKHGESTADVNIVAKFPWGSEVVETLNIKSKDNVIDNTSHLTCNFALEKALFILLLDGLTNSTSEGYLRLHRKMAPYQISFALDEGSRNGSDLKELAELMHCRLAAKKLSTCLPDLLPYESQVTENLKIGVAYTAVLNDSTLSNGIFGLLNSSTMLKAGYTMGCIRQSVVLINNLWQSAVTTDLSHI